MDGVLAFAYRFSPFAYCFSPYLDHSENGISVVEVVPIRYANGLKRYANASTASVYSRLSYGHIRMLMYWTKVT